MILLGLQDSFWCDYLKTQHLTNLSALMRILPCVHILNVYQTTQSDHMQFNGLTM